MLTEVIFGERLTSAVGCARWYVIDSPSAADNLLGYKETCLVTASALLTGFGFWSFFACHMVEEVRKDKIKKLVAKTNDESNQRLETFSLLANKDKHGKKSWVLESTMWKLRQNSFR